MRTLSDVYDELACIAHLLSVLCFAVTDEYAESCGKPSSAVLQDSIYSVEQHIERIMDDVEQIDRNAKATRSATT